MKIVKGTAISPGIAIGKAYILRDITNSYEIVSALKNEKKKFLSAIKKASKVIDEKIAEANNKYDYRISEIFDAHKYIINDPVLIQNTLDKIKDGMNAFKAYDEALHEFIQIMESSENEYMLGRIIDIIDASDKVKVQMGENDKNNHITFREPTIIIEDEIKPSVIFSSLDLNMTGFISKKGFFHQHSGIIARTIKIPEIIVPEILEHVQEGDVLLIDGNEGLVYINPNEKVIYEKRGAQ